MHTLLQKKMFAVIVLCIFSILAPKSTFAQTAAIATQPANQTVTAGDTATFTVTIANGPCRSFWYVNGAGSYGAFGSTISHSIANTTAAMNGWLVFVNLYDCGSTGTNLGNSQTAILTVNSSATAPAITTQPANQTVTAGQTATFAVTASGTVPLSYQWKKNGANISGATSSSYISPATTSASSGSIFSVVVSNSAGSATSGTATLTVNASTPTGAPAITQQPQSETVAAGQSAVFTVVVSNGPCRSFWYVNGTGSYGSYDSTISYTIPSTTAAMNGWKVYANLYGCGATGANLGNSQIATLTVTQGAAPPTITAQPASQTVKTGQAATFSVANTGTAPFGYQWQKNGANISGATSSSYVTPAATMADNGSTFVAVVSNPAGNITSNAATLAVISDTTSPTVSITSPTSGTSVSGTIAVSASASDNVRVASVQFQVDGTNKGGADTASPYSYSLDTTTLSNGSHSLTAVAVDTSGNHATSAAVPITVSNQAGSAVPTYANNGAGCPINTVVGGPSDTVTQYNCPLPNPTGAGNLLVVWLRYRNGNSPTVSFTDNIGGNTYTLAKSCTDAGNSGTVSALYYVEGVKAGVTVVHVNYTASAPFTQMGIYEYYNTGALDSAACDLGNSATISPGTLTFSAKNDLVVNFAHNDNNTPSTSCSPGSQGNISWIMRSALVISPEPACFQYGVYNTTTSFVPSMTFATSTSNISVAAAFKAASGGTPPPGGIRVIYVQHDNGPNHSGAQTLITPQFVVTGDLALMITIGGCDSNTPASCNYPTRLSDGFNNWTEVTGASFFTNTGSQFEEPASIWYAPNARSGLYTLAMTMHPCPNNNGCDNFPSNFLIFDIAGAASSPLDLTFGGSGNGLATFQSVQTTSGAITSFTAAPSFQNELVIAETCYQSNTFTSVTSPPGAQFLTSTYNTETNYTWNDSNCGYALLYNGSSTAAETWTWVHDASQSAGSGRGLAIGAAFQAAIP